MLDQRCMICNETATVTPYDTGSGYVVKCTRCGRFEITDEAFEDVDDGISKRQQAKLSGWIYDQNQRGERVQVTSDAIDRVGTASPPSIQDKADRLLQALVKRTNELGEEVSLQDPALIAAIYGEHSEDVKYFAAEMLRPRGFVRLHTRQGATVLPDGFVRVEELLATKAASAQCFVAMWFGAEMKAIYDQGLDPAVRGAGYDPLRVDLVEHAGKIDDEIIAQIRRSGLMVADFTGHRGGVYFEAGFARGLGIPVFWTCREDDLKNLHFDIRQFNFINWTDASDLRRRLQNRIEAMLGDGPRKPQAT